MGIVLPAEGGGGSSGTSDLERGVGALKRFQTRVNKLLSELEESAAGGTKMSAQTISRASLSGQSMAEFPEAEGLYAQYNRVHQSLVRLSKSLGDQITVLSIGVHAADVGFDNVEEDKRREFAAIQARIDRERAAAEGKSDKPQAPTNNDKSSDGGTYR
ncbi:hypothetical protein J7E88_33585 [Streptomyces sp. ISL-10]|uniref:hypothetical protein n=1 Tax=Streptomyces sp. ISL-10 TaxID=2819172 RepID=UPI001BED3916|nr:hypothetical protein [Streptomyces sp. ISL-10]MBT2370072.1 hypothetical protein [Streptomyces sp. ISL-10]